MIYNRKCGWILQPARKTLFAPPLDFEAAIYCGNMVSYTVKVDAETGLKRRFYEAFCPIHLSMAQAEGDDE